MLVSRSPTAATLGARKIVLAKPNHGIPKRIVKSAILGAKVLEKAADMLQNVESMSPQTIAPKARKRVSEARRSVQAALSCLTSYHNGKLACKHTAIGLNVMPSHIRKPTQ